MATGNFSFFWQMDFINPGRFPFSGLGNCKHEWENWLVNLMFLWGWLKDNGYLIWLIENWFAKNWYRVVKTLASRNGGSDNRRRTVFPLRGRTKGLLYRHKSYSVIKSSFIIPRLIESHERAMRERERDAVRRIPSFIIYLI